MFSSLSISSLIVHHIGNKGNDEPVTYSDSTVDLADADLREALVHYMTKPFAEPVFYSFTFSDGEIEYNPVYDCCRSMLENPETFLEKSAEIAGYLYEGAVNPKFKAGYLVVARLAGIVVDGVVTDAIAVFKTDGLHTVLKPDVVGSTIAMKPLMAIDAERADKGCIVMNVHAESGYKVCAMDSARTYRYWIEDFLRLAPVVDGYHTTNRAMQVAKEVVTEHFAEHFEMSKPDQIDLLNRTMSYFKERDVFEKTDFEQEVLQDANLIDAFRDYEPHDDSSYGPLPDRFDISDSAVKRQARAYKSVIKLDRNFHIYIHGDRKLIQQEVEADGRKYFKIYYENEF